MIAIACVDKNNGIGKDGKLLISIPEDWKWFKDCTLNSVVIMGRKTLFSHKDKSLKNNYKEYDNIFFIDNESELNDLLSQYKDKKVFLIGGGEIYKKFIDKCDEIYLTRVDKEFEVDAFFPDFSKLNFKIYDVSDIHYYNDIPYQFIKYKREIN